MESSCEAFLRSLNRRRPETSGTYERSLREFRRWCRKDGRFRFLVSDVKRYKRYLARARKLSPVSVSTYLTALRRFCDYLVTTKVLNDNPAAYVSGIHRPRIHARDVLNPDDAQRLLDALSQTDERGLRDNAIVQLMLRCGLSDSEITRANIGDMEQQDRRMLLAVQGKGRARKDAAVTLPLEVFSAIDRYLGIRPNRDPAAPLFVSAGNSSRGRRMTTRAVRDRVNYYLEQTGLRGRGDKGSVTALSLRHTAALILARSGATVEEIKEQMRLGTRATAQLYLHAKPSSRRTTRQTLHGVSISRH
jgi:integrase/recombinase XerC